MQTVYVVDNECEINETWQNINGKPADYLKLLPGKEPDFGDSNSPIFCVYILTLASGGLKYQIDFVKNNHNVMHWAFYVLDGTGSLKNSFSHAIHDLDATYEYIESLDEVNEIHEELEGKASKTCMLVARKGWVGRHTMQNSLHRITGWQVFIPENDADLSNKAKRVNHIILMGCKAKDFDIPKITDNISKVSIWVNKIDMNVQSYIEKGTTFTQIRTMLNEKNDWNIPANFSRFFMGALIYEEYLHQTNIDNGYINTLKINDDFVMWDEFGLPCLRKEYESENIIEFLNQITQINRLKDIITNNI